MMWLQAHLEVDARAPRLCTGLRLEQPRVHVLVPRDAMHDAQRGLRETWQRKCGGGDVERGRRERRAGEVEVCEAWQPRQRVGEGAAVAITQAGVREAQRLEAGACGEHREESGREGEGHGDEGELEEASEA